MRGLLVALLLARAAHAADDPVSEARKGFVEGAELVKRSQWSEALAAFEGSARLHAHAVTTYNMAACERAMGRYTRARALFRRSLDQSAAGTGKLPDSLAEQARAHRDEIDRLLARLEVTVDPPEASIAVDGRPLEIADGVAIAGIAPPGPGAPPPSPTFALQVDPGAHVFVLTRKGFTDVVVNKTIAPGAHTALKLQLDRLPATLHVSASREGAIVSVDGKDVGPVPAEVQRAAGTYKVLVEKPGFITYHTTVSVRAGEEAKLRANLEQKKTPIYKRWWFWTAAAVVLAGASVGTYFAAREPPRLDGGGLGWTIKVR